jgi:AcrR family transcriptional regulator
MIPRARKKPEGAYHHGDLRASLIAAAVRVAKEDGVEAIQLRDLARRVNVSSAAPFRHFADRMALLVAVAEEGARRLVTAQDEAASKLDDPKDAARARGVAYVRFAVAEPGFFRVMHIKEVIARSELIESASKASREGLDAVLGKGPQSALSMRVGRMTAGALAAQALVYGLARLIDDGLIGKVTPDEAAALAHELTGVLRVER